jgi:hypothetical protein
LQRGHLAVNDFWRSTPNDVADGTLDRESLERGMAALRDSSPWPPEPPTLIVSPGTQNEGREQAIGAARTARWLWWAAEQLPWWAWRRRSWLTLAGIERANHAETMWSLFGTGDDG